MTIPSAERQEEFLQTTPNAVVATIRRSGLPQVTPNWFLWTGTEEGDAVRDPTIELIRKYREPADVIPHWDAISAASARVLIVVQPDQFLWHDR